MLTTKIIYLFIKKVNKFNVYFAIYQYFEHKEGAVIYHRPLMLGLSFLKAFVLVVISPSEIMRSSATSLFIRLGLFLLTFGLLLFDLLRSCNFLIALVIFDSLH